MKKLLEPRRPVRKSLDQFSLLLFDLLLDDPDVGRIGRLVRIEEEALLDTLPPGKQVRLQHWPETLNGKPPVNVTRIHNAAGEQKGLSPRSDPDDAGIGDASAVRGAG